jgi:uncharacterized OB-fold protein
MLKKCDRCGGWKENELEETVVSESVRLCGCDTSTLQGWQCPVCGRVMSPWVSECVGHRIEPKAKHNAMFMDDI